MDPSIMKFMEDDEDESMHSGADLEAFTAALNRDIGGDPSTISQPSEPDAVGVMSQASSSESKPLAGQQSQEMEQQLHSQPPEQHSLQMKPPEQESVAKDEDQKQEQPQSSHQQPQTEAGSQKVEKDQVKIPEQDPAPSQKLDRRVHAESQHQHPTVPQLNTQQASGANDGTNPANRARAIHSLPFHLLIPVLRPHLDKDRSMQLQSMFSKLRSNEVSKEDFLRVVRNIVGDQMLRQAANKVQFQLQAQAARNPLTNSNQYSLQAQAASQQLSSHSAPKIADSQVFPPSHATSSSQNQKGQKSPPRQPHVPAPSPQMQIDSSFATLNNCSQKSREIDNKSDVKKTLASQFYSTNLNAERESSTASVQAGNKQQHPQLPQPSFSMYGSTAGSFQGHPFARPPVSSAPTCQRPQSQTPQMRQASQTQGMPPMHLGAAQAMNMLNVPKHDIQNTSNETKKVHGGSLTGSHLLSQKKPAAWQPMTNKENNGPSPSMGYVKQEVVDHTVEPSPKFQFTANEGSSFGSAHIEQGNPTLGSLKDDRLEKQSSRLGFPAPTSALGTNMVSAAMAARVDPTIKMPSVTPPTLAGTSARTPSKKPSVGQKKPLEALGTSPPPPSKKQKTSGAFVDQSIEQLNDVTAVSGVNLREEEEQLFSAPKEDSRASEATRKVVQEEEERLILHKGPLQKKLAEIMSKSGLESIGADVERCLSMCVEERLRGFISYLIRLSKQRVDLEKTRHRFVVTSDVRRHILATNRKAKDDWDKKQAEEAEKHRKLNESEGNAGTDTDKEKDENRSKIVKANKEEDEKMRATAANVAARAAVGGDDMLSKWQLMAEQARQKREGLDGASGSQPSRTTNSKPMSGFGRREHQEGQKKGSSVASGNGGMRKLGRNPAPMPHPKVACNITIKDVVAVLEREPQMSKSTLIYRLYDKLAGDSATE